MTEERQKLVSELERILNQYSFGSELITFSDQTDQDLEKLKQGQLINLPNMFSNPCKIQECHAMSAYLWMLDPSIQIYNGFALIEEEIVNSSWYHHSFVVKDNIILEPTTLKRDKYFGIPLSPSETQTFVLGELTNIHRFADEFNICREFLSSFLIKD